MPSLLPWPAGSVALWVLPVLLVLLAMSAVWPGPVAQAATATGAANNTHPIKPSSTIIPIKSYYGTMLRQSSESPFRVQHLELSAHRLVQSGPCVYNTTAIRPFPIDPIESVEDTPKGETDTFCPAKPGGRTTHMFIPRGKIISNPSMNFQPILEQIGEQAASSVSLPPTSHGTSSRITINLNPKRHSGEADVFYSRSQPSAAGTKQLKELKFRTRGNKEAVAKVWY